MLYNMKNNNYNIFPNKESILLDSTCVMQLTR